MTSPWKAASSSASAFAWALLAGLAIMVGVAACGGGSGSSDAASGGGADAGGGAVGPDTSIAGGPDPVSARSGLPSSGDLVDAALAAGTIDAEQALLYKVYADYGDPALPAEFRGDDGGQIESTGWAQVYAAIDRLGGFGMLSSATADALRRFAAPPYIQGSWWNQQHPKAATSALVRGGRSHAAAAAAPTGPDCRFWEDQCPQLAEWSVLSGKTVNVWFLTANEATDFRQAIFLVREFDTQVAPKLKALMGRDPLTTDATSKRVDVILYDLGVDKNGKPNPEGKTVSSVFGPPNHVPAHIYLNRRLPDQGLQAQAAHEYMHAIQFSYQLAKFALQDYIAMFDATAVWATEFVHHDNNWEHGYPGFYLDRTWYPLDQPPSPADKNFDERFRYGIYLFPLYLSRKFSPDIIRELWERAQFPGGDLLIYDDVLAAHGTSFAETWPKFIAAAWNLDGLKYFQTLDDIAASPSDGDGLSLDARFALGASGFNRAKLSWDAANLDPKKWPEGLPHAASRYYRVLLDDPSARSVMFVNGLTFKQDLIERALSGSMLGFTGLAEAKRRGASMQVYLKVNGQWQTSAIDVTNVPFATVCRDDPAGNVEEVVFMFGNGNIDAARDKAAPLKAPAIEPGFVATDIGCRDWTGSVDITVDSSTAGRATVETLKVSNLRLHTSMPTAVPPPPATPIPYPLADGDLFPASYGYLYAVVAGTASRSFTDRSTDGPGCNYAGSDTFPIAGNSLEMHTLTNWTPVVSTASRGITLNGLVRNALPPDLAIHWVCTDPDGKVTTGTDHRPGVDGVDLVLRQTDSSVRIKAGGLVVTGTGLPGATNTSGIWTLTGETH